MATKKRKSANYKVFILAIAMALIFTIVGANVFIVSVLGFHLNSQTQFGTDINNIHTVDRAIPASRGRILDHNDTVIAQDLTAYTLQASLDETRKNGDDTPAYIDDKEAAATVIADVLKISYDDVMGYLNSDALQVEFGAAGKYLNIEQKDKLIASKIPGLMFQEVITRNYPQKVFASKLIGYSQYDEHEARQVGQMGLEMLYDEQLKGTDGHEKYTHDRDEYRLRFDNEQRIDPKNGNDIKLTLDRGIQETLDTALKNITTDPGVKAQDAWGIVMEVKTGKILAYGDAPSFDPNNPDFKGKFYDLVANEFFEPGSTMKTFSVAAAIEEGVWDDAETFDSTAFHVGINNGKAFRLASSDSSVHTITNAGGYTYGMMRYDYGYALSSNVMIAELLTKKLDPEVYHDYLYKLGFYKTVDTDNIPESDKGTDLWSEPLEKISNGFGQGSTASLLQLAQAYTAVLNDGKMVKPYYIDEIINPETQEVSYKGQTQNLGTVFSKETAKHIQDLMRYVVDDRGSGARFKIDEANVIAKTGTAQTVVPGEVGYSQSIYNFSSAVALPYEDPEVLVYTAYKAVYGHDVDYSAVHIRDVLRKVATTYNMTKESKENVVSTIETKPLDNYINMRATIAADELTKGGYKPIVIGNGPVIREQQPLPLTRLASNEKVFLMTSSDGIKLPDFNGWSYREVMTFLEMSGIKATVEGGGFVNEQSIAPGTAVTSEINLTLKLK